MLKSIGNSTTMEGAIQKQPVKNGIHDFNSPKTSKNYIQTSSFLQTRLFSTKNSSSSIHLKLPKIEKQQRHTLKTRAIRRRRSNTQTDTYVLLEPGKNEEFISEDELRERLKGWLENWPEKVLPPDLARFKTLDDAVTYLIKSVCELEIDGDVGSIQWYEVRLE